MNRRKEIDFDYFGYSDEDATARYHDTEISYMEEPVGDLFDDDTYWMDDEDDGSGLLDKFMEQGEDR